MTYKNTNKIILFIIIITGIYLCITGGYGSDEDTLPMIGTFLNYMNGNFMTSRFTGYPVAEFVIGFISYNFGSYLINLIIFLSFISGSIIFYLCFEKNKSYDYLILFIILLLSNPILFFENLEPMDYSLAFLFFSLGYYSLIKNKIELSIIFFGICIGTRINFAPFILIAIFFIEQKFIQNNFRRVTLILCSLFVGCLFYLPVWINSGLGFEWLRAGRPDGDFIEYFVRFIYKIVISFGIIQSLILIFLLKLNYKKFVKHESFKIIIYLILANLLIFLYIPAEKSYLQPMMIFFYYIIYQVLKIKYIYLIIALNFITWFINFDLIKIEHRYANICDPIQAIGARIEPRFIKGYLSEFNSSRVKIKCWIDTESDYGKKILKGKALKK